MQVHHHLHREILTPPIVPLFPVVVTGVSLSDMKKEQIQQEIDKCKKEISLHQIAIDALNKTYKEELAKVTEKIDDQLIGMLAKAPEKAEEAVAA